MIKYPAMTVPEMINARIKPISVRAPSFVAMVPDFRIAKKTKNPTTFTPALTADTSTSSETKVKQTMHSRYKVATTSGAKAEGAERSFSASKIIVKRTAPNPKKGRPKWKTPTLASHGNNANVKLSMPRGGVENGINSSPRN